MKRTMLLAVVAAVGLWAADAKVAEAKKMIQDGKFKEAIDLLDTQYKTNPKSAEVKAALADAHYGSGESYLNNNQMPPRMKYPSALKEYRAVLDFEKDSKRAKDRIAMIEGIYKQMGRPVPQ